MPRASSLVALALSLLVSLAGCSSPECADSSCLTAPGEIRPISTKEALADFDELTTSFRSLYGALHRKEQRYGFQFDSLVKSYRKRVGAAKTEADKRGLFQEFISEFRDPHVALTADLISDSSHGFRLPFLAMPVEDTFVVYAVSASLGANPPVQVGDELLAINNVPAKQLVAGYVKYAGVANPLTAGHFASLYLTYRPLYLSQGLHANDTAKVQLRNAAGVVRVVSLNWTELPRLLPVLPAAPEAGASTADSLQGASEVSAQVAEAEMTKFGSRVPFFMTPAVRASLGITSEVAPSPAALTKFGLSAQAAAAVHYFAVTYSVGSKKVLLVRLPSYAPPSASDALNYLRALLNEQQSQVDGLILDETHNPGGSINFAAGVASLFAQQPFNGYVEELHGDRLWIQTYANFANLVRQVTQNPNDAFAAEMDNRAHEVDAAYSSNQPLSAPIPMFFSSPTFNPDPAHWTKPALVLTDELSVSCADFVPLIIQANKMAPLFGQRTMGGGGNVEHVATLTNTQAQLTLSRGLGTVYDPTGQYPEANFIEDNGVTPDIQYSHTLADFRAGYVGYVDAFNQALAARLY